MTSNDIQRGTPHSWRPHTLWYCLLAAIALPGPARAAGVLGDAYTSVRMDFAVPYVVSAPSSPDLSKMVVTTPGGATFLSFEADAPATYTLGEISGQGRAEFFSLGAQVAMTGSSATKALVIASSYDVLTVAAPTGVPAGTTGTLGFVYDLDGLTRYEINVGARPRAGRPLSSRVAQARMDLSTYAAVDDVVTNTSSASHAADTLTYGEAVALAEPNSSQVPTFPPLASTFLFEVPFVYGEPLGVLVSFQIEVELDRTDPSIQFSPYAELRGENILGDFEMDFLNSASLAAIVNAGHPDSVITGEVLDYTSFVVGSLPEPVPLPPAGCLLLVAMPALYTRLRRASQDGSPQARAPA